MTAFFLLKLFQWIRPVTVTKTELFAHNIGVSRFKIYSALFFSTERGEQEKEATLSKFKRYLFRNWILAAIALDLTTFLLLSVYINAISNNIVCKVYMPICISLCFPMEWVDWLWMSEMSNSYPHFTSSFEILRTLAINRSSTISSYLQIYCCFTAGI